MEQKARGLIIVHEVSQFQLPAASHPEVSLASNEANMGVE
jgi:hypothetical protein